MFASFLSTIQKTYNVRNEVLNKLSTVCGLSFRNQRNNQPIHSTCFALSRDISKAITRNESGGENKE